MKSAELLVKCLENEGIKYMFGVPGEENIDVMDALLESDIEFITTRHETGAAFMAGIMGRLTGKPGVCLSTLGPGATNMLTGVANSNMDHNPIVAITGQASLERQHKQSHQAYDLVAMYRPVTKWNASVLDHDIVAEVVRKAFKVAAAEKPGATHIDLPEDIARAEVKNKPLPITETRQPEAAKADLARAAEIINQAKKPILFVGNGVTRGDAARDLVTFAEKIQAPVTETFMGKGAISWTHEQSLMTAGLSFGDYVNNAIDSADLIVSIGYDMSEYPPSNWNKGNVPVLHVDTVNAEVDAHYPVVHEVVGDLALNLQQLAGKVESRKTMWKEAVKTRKMILDEYESYANDEAYPIKPQKIIYDLREFLGEDDIVLSDVGAHKMWMARMYHCYKPNTCLITNGLASMGVAVPGAIAAKLVHPEKKVVAVVGDGSFLMTGMELETAVRLKLNVIYLIWTDHGYGLIEWKQQNAFHRASHIKFGNPDFVKLAESYGATGIHVDSQDSLKTALEKATECDGPVVIDCPVDYRENTKLSDRMTN